MSDDHKGKECIKCESPMSNLYSQFLRICTNGKCGNSEQWNLDPGQAPLLGESRDRGIQ